MPEPTLTDELYIAFRDLLLRRAGLHYPERKRADLAYGLAQALEGSPYRDPAALYDAALAGGPAWDTLLAHLTIGETYFFRNAAQFAALRRDILPELIRLRRSIRSLRVWSAGCATGEEPYSLAMTLRDALPAEEPWAVSILATDINPVFLARAREGLYREWSFRETPEDVRARFFTREEGGWRLAPAVRHMVHFARLNLAEPCYPSPLTNTTALDLIVCRNVTIYFDPATTRQVAARFFDALAPGGWLVVGHAEPQASVYAQYEVVNFPDTVVYRKPLAAPLFAVPPAPPAPPAPPPPSPPVRWSPPSAPAASPAAPLPPGVEDLTRAARRSADLGQWDEAERLCRAALERDRLSVPAHHLLAQIDEHRGRLDDALTSYRRTTFLDRDFAPGLIGQGNIWRQLGRPAEARRCYRGALARVAAAPPQQIVPGASGATAGELAAYCRTQLAALGEPT